MRLAPVLLVLALAGCSRGFSPDTDEPEPPSHVHPVPAPAHDPHAAANAPVAPGEPRRPHDVPSIVQGGPPTAGGLAWTAEAPLESVTPDTDVRAAQYTMHGENGAGDATLAVFHFPGMGGTIDDNVDRWLGMVHGPDGQPVTREGHVTDRTVNELHVTIVDARGSIASGMPGGPATAEPGQRLLGAIVQGPDGLVFFKMTGPEATVDHAQPAFEALVATIHPG